MSRTGGWGAAAVVVLLLAGCSEPDPLESYTDEGDACPQAVSAIGYADDVLKPLGQEPYQDFDDVTRSRLAAVAGTLALEARDWPSRDVADQAEVVQPLAQAAAEKEGGEERERALLEYRLEATRLVLLCRDEPGTGRPVIPVELSELP